MKTLLFIAILSLFDLVSWAQPDSSMSQVPGNSYKKEYLLSNPTLRYSYHDSGQIHDYSGNWDFDGDGMADSLLFIGNGGAHLYFHLRLVLSSDHVVRDFPFLLLDMPYLGVFKDLNRDEPPLLPQFVVHDFDSDGLAEIYLNFDTGFSPIPRKWKKRGLTSRYVLIGYKNAHLTIKNFK